VPKAFSAVLLLVALAPAWAQNDSFSITADAGSFNRAYQDRQYVSPSSVTFAVPYGSVGAEFQRSQDRNVLGGAVAQTTIGSGSVFNVDRTERQPLTVLTLASVFVGRDEGWWEADLGVGALVQLQAYGSDGYLQADGSVAAGRAAGLDWNHRESYTLITVMVRLFAENQPHLMFHLARGDLSLTENLFNVEGVLPTSWGRFNAQLSFSSPQGYWFSGPGYLRSNERLTLGCEFGKEFRWGIHTGVLIRPVVAGTGSVDPLQRLSFGIDMAAGWPHSN
jgi:hypothetical protein